MSLFGRKVRFLCDNYVLESDDLLEMAQPEFDTILCLSTTKWIHLNFGDDGIKRAFKRMYAQLKPGEIIFIEALKISFKSFHTFFFVFSKWN
jgi:7SK snRNA methylphosphate capping enzyme